MGYKKFNLIIRKVNKKDYGVRYLATIDGTGISGGGWYKSKALRIALKGLKMYLEHLLEESDESQLLVGLQVNDYSHCDMCGKNKPITHISNEGNVLCEECVEDLFIEESIMDHEYNMVFDRFDTEYWKEL